jgi:hypothetical protein
MAIKLISYLSLKYISCFEPDSGNAGSNLGLEATCFDSAASGKRCWVDLASNRNEYQESSWGKERPAGA